MRLPIGLAALLLFAANVRAEEMPAGMHHDHAAMTAEEPAPITGNAPTRAYKQAMQRMHEGMDVPYTGDADKDFAAGMIPHHQGAIDMAEILLKYGKDPDLKRLAKSIIVAQKKEIRFMQNWQAKQRAAKGAK